ncbi:hypothetical protein CK934_21920 [Chitinophaga sp. MD30]|nr:hypothetical protein CK934_21920 [Chitinophaga sp. MD30]
MHFTVILSCLLLLLPGYTLPAHAQKITLSRQIDQLIQSDTPHRFNGMISIFRNGKEIYHNNKGWADLEKKQPFTANAQFTIASISKQIAAVLILQQVANHRIQLDKPIGEYLPDLPHNWKQQVTIQQLLTHTSGLNKQGDSLENKPGTRYAYSNTGYILLGRVLEKVTGSSYAVLTATLFRQCKMYHSLAPADNTAQIDTSTIVQGYTENEQRRLEPARRLWLPFYAPAGATVSTVSDLQQWLQCLHNGRLLPPALYKNMITPAITYEHRWGTLGYGYGLMINQQQDIPEIGHSGYVEGFIATAVTFPQARLSLVILENVSWDPADMSRVYRHHDNIRTLIREKIKTDQFK